MKRNVTCAMTGHRPTRFRFKYDENNNGCKRIKKRIRDQLVQLYEQGFRQFWVGGALGVDMWAGEILLRLKEQPEYILRAHLFSAFLGSVELLRRDERRKVSLTDVPLIL